MKNILLILGALLIINCDKNRSSDAFQAIESQEIVSKLSYNNGDVNFKVSPSNNSTQKLIKTSSLTFETASVHKTFENIKSFITACNGYIQHDEEQKLYNRFQKTLIVRIPTNYFQPIIDSISKQVTVFDSKETTLKDVTEEFIDLEARLKSKRALEARYLQLLAKAKNVKDMLQIERQISIIREEIEAKQGRLKYLNNKINLSTLHITFYEITPIEKPSSQSFGARIWDATRGGVIGVGEFIIGILYVWPFVLIGIVLFYIIRKKIRKRKK